MKPFVAFLKKELLESVRSSKFLILGALFLAFGIMNPMIAKLTPWLMETLSKELAESGMTITAVSVDALTSWTQFFKNIPMALIVFVFMYGNIFTKEYESSTLILILTKGLARYKIVLAKTLVMLFGWTAGYFLTFAITYAYNAYFWDNGVVSNLACAVVNWWLFGVYVIALVVLFSVISKSFSGVLVGTVALIAIPYVMGVFPKLSKYVPTQLMSTNSLLVGTHDSKDFAFAICITAVLSLSCIVCSIPIFNKKQL